MKRASLANRGLLATLDCFLRFSMEDFLEAKVSRSMLPSGTKRPRAIASFCHIARGDLTGEPSLATLSSEVVLCSCQCVVR